MKQNTLLVLAAGMGSRYGGLKQLDPVGPGGELIIDYSLFDALRAGINHAVFVVTPAIKEQLEAHFASGPAKQMKLDYVYQELSDLPSGFRAPEQRSKPWGTGHAVWSARKCLNKSFGIINADDFYGFGAYKLLSESLVKGVANAKPMQLCLIAYRLINTLSAHGSVARGVCQVDQDHNLQGVSEHTAIKQGAAGAIYSFVDDKADKELDPDTLVSMNMWGLSPECLALLEKQFVNFLKVHGKDLKAEFYIPSAVDDMIKAGTAQVKTVATDEEWIGMTYSNDRPAVVSAIAELIKKGVYPERLWA